MHIIDKKFLSRISLPKVWGDVCVCYTQIMVLTLSNIHLCESISFGNLVYLIKTKSFFYKLFHLIFTGRKSGKGCFIYEKGSKERLENPEVADIISKFSLVPKIE